VLAVLDKNMLFILDPVDFKIWFNNLTTQGLLKNG